ncbi:MAG: PIN domain-containing protein [Defluviitaleaceae bacterium]|nr:PIN domain-containing protein [Defluviitaleaceae bacterium]
MKILIDTNVVLDVVLVRGIFYENSRKILVLSDETGIGYVSVSQLKDVSYFVRKMTKSQERAKVSINALSAFVGFLDLGSVDVMTALASPMKDFEDALLAACAKRHGMDYIVTRNEADFAHSPVPALTPEQFLEITNPKG